MTTPQPTPRLGSPDPAKPSDEFLAGYKRGLLDGLEAADNDPCPDGGRCPVPLMAEQRPLAGDEELASAHDRLRGDDLDGSDG